MPKKMNDYMSERGVSFSDDAIKEKIYKEKAAVEKRWSKYPEGSIEKRLYKQTQKARKNKLGSGMAGKAEKALKNRGKSIEDRINKATSKK